MSEVSGFSRKISPELIAYLNVLEADKSSWWHRLQRKKGVFVAIRPGYLSVYSGGGSLLTIRLSPKGRLSCEVHEEYLLLRNKALYVDLNLKTEHKFHFITTLEELIKDENFKSVQRRIKKNQGKERQGVGLIASKISNVIDIEVTDEQSSRRPFSSETKRRSTGSIDLSAVDPDGFIWFYEAKLLSNYELRASRGSPPIIGQLVQYEEWIMKKKQRIIREFKSIRNAYFELQGDFFKKRLKQIPEIKGVRSRPGLLIYGYNKTQEKKELPSLLDNFKEHGFNAGHILTIGKPGSLTEKRLFSLKKY